MEAQNGNRGGHPGRVDFSHAPFLIIWETTRSCGLACQHCRADAILRRDPRELDTAQGKDILDQAAAMGTPIVILSGGDPLNRTDIEELVAHGKSRGLRMGTIPAATGNLTRERVRGLKEAGLDQIAFSLDGPTAELHDAFRGVAGSFDKTLEGISYAHEAGLPLQINTCFASWNFKHLNAMVALVRSLGVVFWEVFFLIPIGRGENLGALTPDQFEEVFERMHRLNAEEKFIIKLTEAQHYRRFVVQKERAVGGDVGDRVKNILARPRGVQGGVGMSPQTVNSGKGFMFIDHTGDICPSGFLPIPCGNVRTHRIAQVYRESSLFKQLRDPSLLKGRCGVCEYANLCGGSRARAHAMTGDYLETDPGCSYQPAGIAA
jgi:radical SAM protein